MQVTFEEFIELIKNYNPDEVEIITKAYNFAKKCHEGQKRESGEPYIVHPLAVAWILANMHADRDTVCAGLLHDVIEDTSATKKQIAQEFNDKIAELVDGVTNLTKANFKSKNDRDYANKRKIILGITKDARIAIIKLADRLHNILTLQYKRPEKRIEKATETMQFYAPLARFIGAERLRRTLEDLSFKHLHPEEYADTKRMIDEYCAKMRSNINQMMIDIHGLLTDENVPHALKIRVKNVYSVYQRTSKGESIENLHDFLAIKVLVDDVKKCYTSLGLVHSLYPPMNKAFKDYICQPKSNMYSSLHTSVFGPESVVVQMQIRTNEMEKINIQGLTAYWDICQGKAGDRMQEILKNKYHFTQTVKDLNHIIKNAYEFVQNFQQNVINENIRIYNGDGQMVEIPEGSTAIDFAYNFGKEVGDRLKMAFINGQLVDPNTVIVAGDRVHLILSEYANGPEQEWKSEAATVKAQRLIRERGKKE